MKKIVLIIISALITTIVFSQEARKPKIISLPHVNGAPAATCRNGDANGGDVISLDSDVDYLQATYYSTGGKAYYTYTLQNYDTELPSLTLETEAASKTHINGAHSVITVYSSLEVEDGGGSKTLSISSATLSFSFVRVDFGGFSEYDVKIAAVASDGNTYTYNSAIVVNAFDADEGYAEIVLEDDEPTSAIETEARSAVKVQKYFENGRVVIEREGQKFDLRGVVVK
ncbi:MAG: hypothetical protein J6U24_00220 [Paludibacteraceae bacterium]|nr:hypothetical protein [Paludibacteraceae bacterium]